MKKYIASYQDKKDQCWDLLLYADSWKEAAREARSHQKEYGRLYSVRRTN